MCRCATHALDDKRSSSFALAIASALALIPSTIPLESANAGARSAAYMIDMRATIPSRCVLRPLAPFVTLERVLGDDVVARSSGSTSFQVICNVPYALSTGPVGRTLTRGRLIPLAASDVHPSQMPATELAPSQEPDTTAQCVLSANKAALRACPDAEATTDDPASGVLPIARGTVSIERRDSADMSIEQQDIAPSAIILSISGRF